MFLAESSEERGRWIGAMRPKQFDVEAQLCGEVYCSIQPRLFPVTLDSSLVNGDPHGYAVGGLPTISDTRCIH